MRAFDSDESILREIREKGPYIWRPINANASNHILGCVLKRLVQEEKLIETDISDGFWIFKNVKLSFNLK